ncbi:oxidoreductase domain-containing protein [Cadophora sp. DSE1049]|nr:oxidoreductase domain-containing protein [Cadophora sp. DSE1049]
MGGFISLIVRVWKVNNPPEPPKEKDALRFGILGTPWTASVAFITPAKSHPGVIVAAVASRDPARGKAYAKKFNIPKVHDSYQALLDDPTIGGIYLALPNGLHYEWTLRALKAGKHVLLEKPSVSNGIEAASLFAYHASLPPASRPVLLEAFHARFHPAWHKFLSLAAEPENIESVSARFVLPAGSFPKEDIRWNYDLAGGSLMDIGTYTIAALRDVFRAEPVACTSATPRLVSKPGDQRIDSGLAADFKFPNGGTGTIDADLARKTWLSLPSIKMAKIVVKYRDVEIDDEARASATPKHVMMRTVTFWGFPAPHLWHRIQVLEKHVWIESGTEKVVEKKEDKRNYTAYIWDEGEKKRDLHWSTYRYMLDEFVCKIRGEKGTGAWIDGEDSVKQMKMIDSGYVKAGLPLRPTSTYKPDT